MRRVSLVLLLLCACGDDAPVEPQRETPTVSAPMPPTLDTTAARSAPPDSVVAERVRRAEDAARETLPFERSAMVFDTMEPPPRPVQIRPRPQPAPPAPTPPRPEPGPPEPAPRPPEPAVSSGSCDVRETESFCFAYTGAGWSRRAATQHCGDAPDSAYRPAACPAEDAIATCRFTRDGAPTLEIVYTYYAPYDLMLAQLACPGEFERVASDS